MNPKPTRITQLQLARITATLAGNRWNVSSLGNSVTTNLSSCELPIMGAEKLWHACSQLFSQTPPRDRRGLRLEDLAMLAASLAHGKPMTHLDRRYVAQQALKLWQKCERQMMPTKMRAEILERFNELENLLVSNRPSKFPVSLKKALKGWLPKRTLIADREHLFRHYLRHSFELVIPQSLDYAEGFVPLTFRTEDEKIELADKEMSRLKTARLNAEEYDEHTIQFANWLKEDAEQKKLVKSYKGGKMKAFKAKLKSAEKGDANSQTDIGRMYAEGDGVKQDYQEAAKWFTKAAQQGQSAAQYNLGLLYFNGLGVKKDEAKAKEWYDKANSSYRTNTKKGQKKLLTSLEVKNCI